MSGAEVIAAVGTGASFLQLIDFGAKVCSRLAEFSVEAKDVPKAFRHACPWLSTLCEELRLRQRVVMSVK